MPEKTEYTLLTFIPVDSEVYVNSKNSFELNELFMHRLYSNAHIKEKNDEAEGVQLFVAFMHCSSNCFQRNA